MSDLFQVHIASHVCSDVCNVMAHWRESSLCQDDSKGSEVLGALRIGSTTSISLEEDLFCGTENDAESQTNPGTVLHYLYISLLHAPVSKYLVAF